MAQSPTDAPSTPVVPTSPPPTLTTLPSTAPPTSTPPSSVSPVPPVTQEPTSNEPEPTGTGTGTGGSKPRPPKTNTSRPYSSVTGAPPGPSTLPGSGGNDSGQKGSGGDESNKSIVAPVVGGIAGALVLAFLVAVFVMRQRKKNKARKRRLDFLDDHNSGPITSGAAAGGSGSAGGATGSHRPDSLSSPLPPRPATPVGRSSGPGGRPLEMAAIGGGAGAAAAHHHHKQQQQQHQADGYDYQQGYQQVPYGGYSDPAQQQQQQQQQPYDQYDQQYDPYYAQHQQQQAQEYYADQQQGYYPEGHSYQQQNQFTPVAPVRGSLSGSPAMTQATAASSSLAYPPPPPSTTTGGHSSPRTTPLQQSAVPVPGGQGSFEKGALYANSTSAARNPQVITEDDVKVPM